MTGTRRTGTLTTFLVLHTRRVFRSRWVPRYPPRYTGTRCFPREMGTRVPDVFPGNPGDGHLSPPRSRPLGSTPYKPPANPFQYCNLSHSQHHTPHDNLTSFELRSAGPVVQWACNTAVQHQVLRLVLLRVALCILYVPGMFYMRIPGIICVSFWES